MHTARTLPYLPACTAQGGSDPGVVWSEGVPGLGGAWSRGGGIPACTEADPPHAQNS